MKKVYLLIGALVVTGTQIFAATPFQNQCAPLDVVQVVALQHNSGPSCTDAAANDAISCLQNTCLQGAAGFSTSPAKQAQQLNCFSEYCGGTACVLNSTASQTQFAKWYNWAPSLCLDQLENAVGSK